MKNEHSAPFKYDLKCKNDENLGTHGAWNYIF